MRQGGRLLVFIAAGLRRQEPKCEHYLCCTISGQALHLDVAMAFQGKRLCQLWPNAKSTCVGQLVSARSRRNV